ncbi:MAG TPA: AtpZ/AtpI family protein [Candidatus Chromulinivoraceae bacterium]|nr:AtpZ/AtpI family protein [Candidatus Chromulinivoraceae bacterium]
MSTSQNDGDKKPVPPDTSTVVLLLGTIGDTTWRMFVPTIGLTILGLLADKFFHTTPWIMVTGIVLGAYLAYALVRRQIKKVKQDDQ